MTKSLSVCLLQFLLQKMEDSLRTGVEKFFREEELENPGEGEKLVEVSEIFVPHPLSRGYNIRNTRSSGE